MKLVFNGWFWGNGMMGVRWSKGTHGLQVRFYFFFIDYAIMFDFKKPTRQSSKDLKAVVIEKK